MINNIRKVFLGLATVFTLNMMALPVGAVQQTQQNTTTCGSTQTQIVGCNAKKDGVESINALITIVLTVMTVIIGIVAVGGLAYAAILYASARDNQSQTGEAITIIRNIVIGLLLYGFTIAIINWLVPGGVIG